MGKERGEENGIDGGDVSRPPDGSGLTRKHRVPRNHSQASGCRARNEKVTVDAATESGGTHRRPAKKQKG